MTSFATLMKLERRSAPSGDRRLVNRLLRYWDELRSDQRLPSPTNLNLDDIKEFVPHAFTIDLAPESGEAKIRFAGKVLARDCGGDMKNRTPDQVPPHSLLARTLHHVPKVVTTGEPVFVSDGFSREKDSQILFRAVMLPFSRDGNQVDYIVGAINCKTVAVDETSPRAWTGTLLGTEDASRGRRHAEPQAERPFDAAALAPHVHREVSELIADIEKGMAPDAHSTAASVGDRAAEPRRAASTRRLVSGQAIVVSSAVAGSGATTTAMHLIVSLLAQGFRVGSIDLDGQQQALTHYLANRRACNSEHDLCLLLPVHSVLLDRVPDVAWYEGELRALIAACDHVVIDVPAESASLSRAAHISADRVLTVISDSVADVDSLATIKAGGKGRVAPSHYADTIVAARAEQLAMTGRTFDWTVIRNRCAGDTSGAIEVTSALDQLAGAFDFHLRTGLADRCLFRALFEQGLTLADLGCGNDVVGLSMAHVAARQELRRLLGQLGLREATRPGSMNSKA